MWDRGYHDLLQDGAPQIPIDGATVPLKKMNQYRMGKASDVCWFSLKPHLNIVICVSYTILIIVICTNLASYRVTNKDGPFNCIS